MSDIKVQESLVDERRFRAVLDHDTILGVVASMVAAQAGVDLNADNVSIRTLHLSARTGGLGASKYEAVCEIVVDRKAEYGKTQDCEIRERTHEQR